MYLVDSKTRRAWPPYWAAHRLRDVRAEVLQDLDRHRTRKVPSGAPDRDFAWIRERGCSERAIREETERRFALLCRKPQDLEAYRREVTSKEA